MIGIAENEHFKIFEGVTREGNKAWSLRLKRARVAIYLGSVEKITLVRSLKDRLEHSEQPDEKYFWIGFGYGTFNVLVSVEDARFLLKYLPLSKTEKKLSVEEETEPPQRAGTMH